MSEHAPGAKGRVGLVRRWQAYLAEAARLRMGGRIFSAFNTNVDVVVKVTPQSLEGILRRHPGLSLERVRATSIFAVPALRTPEDVLAVLRDRMLKGKSFHITVENDGLLPWLEEEFAGERSEMGGQAGIIANQMAALEARACVYTPLLSPKQARLFDARVQAPALEDGRLVLRPVRHLARPADPTKVNWIMEFARGETFRFGEEAVVAARANRVIVATRPRGLVMAFDPGLRPHLDALGREVDVAFMAGYHYAGPTVEGRPFESYLEESVQALAALRRGNPRLRLHYEYVPMKHQGLEPRVLEAISREIQSFGINENELKRLLQALGRKDEFQALFDREGSYNLYRGALALLEELGLERVQVHNLGYYVLVLRKPYVVAPERVRAAALFASAVNAMKAKYGGYVSRKQVAEGATLHLSDVGFDQLEAFASQAGPGRGPGPAGGIWEFSDHYVLIVPAHVVPNPVSTVGMGDTISATSYALEFEEPVYAARS